MPGKVTYKAILLTPKREARRRDVGSDTIA